MLNSLTIAGKHLRSPIDYIIILIIVTLPLSMMLNGVAIILLCASIIVYNFIKNIKIKPSILWLFGLPVLFDLTGLVYSSNIENGFDFCIRRVTILLFPLIFSIYPVSKKKLRILLYLFTFLCSLIGLVCLLWAVYRQLIWSIEYDKWEINWFIFTYHTLVKIVSLHAVYFSIYVGFCIVFLSMELFQKQFSSNRIKGILIFLLAFNFLILLLLSSRMAISSTLLFFFFIVNYSLWERSKLLIVGTNLVLIISLLIAFSQLTILNERFLSTFSLQKDTRYIQKWSSTQGNISIREQKWHGALLVIKDSPILGTGTGDLIPKLVEKYREIGFELGVQEKYDPHNQILNTTARTGLFSGLTFLLIFLIPMYYSLKKRHFLYLAFLFLVFCVSITESVLSSQKGIVFYSLFNSLLFSSTFTHKERGLSKLSKTKDLL